MGASATRKRTIRFFRSYSGTPHFRHSRGCSRERPAWSGRGRARDDLQRRGPRRWSGRRGAPPARLLPRLSRPRCWSRCPLAPQSMIQRKIRAIRIQRRFSVYRQRPVDFFSDSPNRARPASSKKTVTGLLSHERTTEQGQHGRLSVHIHSFTIYRAPGTLVLRRSQASPSRSARSASQTASRRRSETGIPFADPASAPRTRA